MCIFHIKLKKIKREKRFLRRRVRLVLECFLFLSACKYLTTACYFFIQPARFRQKALRVPGKPE